MERTHRKDGGRQMPKHPFITNSREEEAQKDHQKMEM
jgi:hypothetical protein